MNFPVKERNPFTLFLTVTGLPIVLTRNLKIEMSGSLHLHNRTLNGVVSTANVAERFGTSVNVLLKLNNQAVSKGTKQNEYPIYAVVSAETQGAHIYRIQPGVASELNSGDMLTIADGTEFRIVGKPTITGLISLKVLKPDGVELWSYRWKTSYYFKITRQ